jgi:acetyl esterase/lipase
MLLAVFVAAIVAEPAHPQEQPPAIEVERDITYGRAGGVPLFLDAYSPTSGEGPFPAIVLVHGGSFTAGDKADPLFVRASQIFASQGFVTFDINYRLAPRYPAPAANVDTRRAVAFVRRNAKRFGIDPANIGIAGSSAGATLAAWVGDRGSGDLESGSRVKAVVAWSGPFDFTIWPVCAATGSERGEGYLPPGPDQLELAEEVSPISYVDPTDPPLLITNAESEQIPLCQAEAMKKALDEVGVPVTLQVFPGSGHALGGNTREALIAAVRFFDEHLRAPVQTTSPPVGEDIDHTRLGPRAIAVLIALLLVALAVGGSLMWRRRRDGSV